MMDVLPLFFLLLFLLQAATPTCASSSSSNSRSRCSVERDDIRLFGSGGDAGRVELCHNETWRYVCAASQWNLATATIACRQLGYESAFMANTATAMAFTGDSGANDDDDAGIHVLHCRGDERTLRDCQLLLGGTDDVSSKSDQDWGKKCTLHEAVGAACSTATDNSAQSTYPAAVEQEVQSYLGSLESWLAAEKTRQRPRQVPEKDECTAIWPEQGTIPDPFRDVQAIREAFVFPDAVTQTYERIETDFYQSIRMQLGEMDNNDSSSLTRMERFAKELEASGVRWNALGMDLSALFPSPITLEQVQAQMEQSRLIETIRDLYLSANQHNGLHWFLDSPYRYYSQPSSSSSTDNRDSNPNNNNKDLVLTDPSARKMFDTLQRDGILLVPDFGADTDSIVQAAEAGLQGDALYRKNETSISGGGSILTSRKPILPLEQLLAHNQTLATVIQAYLGPSLLHGYKVTRLTSGLTTTDQYNAGLYHHDRVGRRLKLFFFLHDVDCIAGHPTKVAAGSHRMLYYKTEDYPVTRFTDDFVERHYEVKRGCGKRGGGFLFDTHTIHKGTVQGEHERTVAIAEYHHVAKCAYSKKANLGIPCPAGDIYRTDRRLAS